MIFHRWVNFARSKLDFSLKPSEVKISLLVESYDEKTAENYRNRYVSEKRIFSKLSKILIPNFDDLNKGRIKMAYL